MAQFTRQTNAMNLAVYLQSDHFIKQTNILPSHVNHTSPSWPCLPEMLAGELLNLHIYLYPVKSPKCFKTIIYGVIVLLSTE